jgi:hypothetical protein
MENYDCLVFVDVPRTIASSPAVAGTSDEISEARLGKIVVRINTSLVREDVPGVPKYFCKP